MGMPKVTAEGLARMGAELNLQDEQPSLVTHTVELTYTIGEKMLDLDGVEWELIAIGRRHGQPTMLLMENSNTGEQVWNVVAVTIQRVA